MPIERIAGDIKGDVVRQADRKVLLRHRYDAAGFAVDHRDRAAPVALAGDAPVAQAEIDLALGLRGIAQRSLAQFVGHNLKGLVGGLAVEEA